MLRRRLVLLPFVGLVMLAGYLGLRLGQPVTETDIIERYVAVYLREAGPGARATDCHGEAGAGPVRLTVVCQGPDGLIRRYPAGPRGRLVTLVTGPVT